MYDDITVLCSAVEHLWPFDKTQIKNIDPGLILFLMILFLTKSDMIYNETLVLET